MSQKKQILIIEDLGVSKEAFGNQLKEANLDYELVWAADKASNDQVEILVNVKKKLDKEIISKYSNLKMIAVAFTGYDSVDLKTCEEKNIAVYNVPSYSTHSVAELAIGMAISFLREIPKADRNIRNGQWTLKPGLELNGRTVGILGTGKIGIQTARIFKVLGCKLIAWSRTEKPEFLEMGGKYVKDKIELFQEADIVSIHLPYTDQTEKFVGKKEMEAMKETAFIINTARGPIIDEEALIEILKSKKIAGACLDVYSKEPISENHPLLSLENCILTPHVAFKTEEALIRRTQTTVENITDFLKGKKGNRVN